MLSSLSTPSLLSRHRRNQPLDRTPNRPRPGLPILFPRSPLLSSSSFSSLQLHPSLPCCRPDPPAFLYFAGLSLNRVLPPLLFFSLRLRALRHHCLAPGPDPGPPPVSERQRGGSEMGGAAFRWVLQLHRDVPKAVRFYSEGLDFNINVCTLRWAELQNGPLKLALMHSPTRCPSRFLFPLYVLSFLFHFSSSISTYI